MTEGEGPVRREVIATATHLEPQRFPQMKSDSTQPPSQWSLRMERSRRAPAAFTASCRPSCRLRFWKRSMDALVISHPRGLVWA